MCEFACVPGDGMCVDGANRQLWASGRCRVYCPELLASQLRACVCSGCSCANSTAPARGPLSPSCFVSLLCGPGPKTLAWHRQVCLRQLSSAQEGSSSTRVGPHPLLPRGIPPCTPPFRLLPEGSLYSLSLWLSLSRQG